MTHVCPTCCEHELVPHPSLDGWLHCPGCSRAVLTDDLIDLVEHLADDGSELAREILECWREQISREVPGGGGDDGLSLSFLRPLGDERAVRHTPVPGQRRKYPLQVTKVKCSSDEMRVALEAWLRAMPDPAEVLELRDCLRSLRRRA